MVDWNQLALFIYIAARMSGFVLFNPLLGRSNLPGIVRTGLVLVFTVSVAATTQQAGAAPPNFLIFVIRILLELALGFLLGMVMNFFFYIPRLAGEAIDTQMGMTMSQIYDPSSQSNMSVTGVLLNLLMTLLFFAANGHHTLLRIMLTSGDMIPFGAVSFGPDVLNRMLELFVECTVFGVKLCLPVLAAELVGQIGMGVLMKVIPQINVFAINIELKVIIGLALLFLLIAPFSEFFLKIEADMLDRLREILVLSAG
ncbi:MAG: flagellar biosynthetic protein FliR [Clostridiales bacterium]|nr:flagellar biosynthetic protein FliR [Clostridiales bacterium]